MLRHFLFADNRTACGIVKFIGEQIPGFILYEGAIKPYPHAVEDDYPIAEDACCKRCLKYAFDRYYQDGEAFPGRDEETLKKKYIQGLFDFIKVSDRDSNILTPALMKMELNALRLLFTKFDEEIS